MQNDSLKFKNSSSSGYSLIELVVVLAIFLIIIGVTVDIFISVVHNQKAMLAEQELMNQTNYALQYMSTALRMAMADPDGSCLGDIGAVYVLTHCPNGTSEACQGVKFINRLENNACQEFFMDDSVNPVTSPLRQIKNGSAAQNLISDKFQIQHGRFILDGDSTLHQALASDDIRPRVTILLDTRTDFFGNVKEKVTQTTISQTY